MHTTTKPILITISTVFALFSETFDVGVDNGTAVTTGYAEATHFAYTGDLDKVIVKLTD